MITTTTDLVKRAQAAADMHDAAITPAQWAYWLTQENLALSIFLARTGWTLNIKTQVINVIGSEAAQYPLATAALAIVAVHQVQGNKVRLIPYNNVVDYARSTVTDLSAKGDPWEYRVIWDQDNDRLVINFYPDPSAGSQFIVSYIPHPPALTMSDSVSYPLGWEERIVLGLARRALAKEESDTREIIGQTAECESRIEESISDRIFAAHSAVRNVDGEVRGWTNKMTYPPQSAWFFF